MFLLINLQYLFLNISRPSFRNIHVVKINEELKRWTTESPIINRIDEEVNNPILKVSPQDKTLKNVSLIQ